MPEGELAGQGYANCQARCTPTPLTTTFTPPISCADYWTPVVSYTPLQSVSLTRNATAEACVPTQWNPECPDCNQGMSNISPGVCPEDAPVASIGIGDPSANATYSQGTSSARCFQSFSSVLRTLSYNTTIYTTTSSYITISDATATSSSRTWWSTTIVTTSTETVFFKSGVLEAGPLIVRFKEGDFQTTSAPLTSSTGQVVATPAEATRTETHVKDSGLTTGAKAGIGVGAALGVLLLVAIGLAIFWLRKKKRRHDEKAMAAPVRRNSEAVNALAPGELPTKWSTAELHAQPMPPKELQASRYREVNPDDPAELGDVSMSSR